MKKYIAPDFERVTIDPKEAFSVYAQKCNPSQLDEVNGSNICPEVYGWTYPQCYINMDP